ncbi:MAG: MBL fold metallo-hydrolase [Haloechinothrix sp.]
MAGRVIRGLLSAALGAASAGAEALTSRGRFVALGGRPDSADCSRSPQFRDGTFRNAAPTRWMPPSDAAPVTAREFLFGGQRRTPSGQIPLVAASGVPALTPDGLHITWYGHASSLVEIESKRVLFDPVWSERVSPSTVVGPRRMHAPPHRLEEIPKLDVIVISHDHYDHLDMATVRTLARVQDAPFVVPLGVGAHLLRWGVAESRIIELDWWDHVEIAGLRVTATPAQHFSGRGLARNNTLWASWVVAGGRRKVFYTGDSGYFDGYQRIGALHGPFDATVIQIGAYNASWPDIHMTPEEGVAVHRDVAGGLLVPVHWGTFNLALHPWAEPADRVWAEAKAHDVALAVPKPGERIDVDDPPAVDGWWQVLG